MAGHQLRLDADQQGLLAGLVGRRAIALVAPVFQLTDMETMRPGHGTFWLGHVEGRSDQDPGRFFKFGGELVSGPGYVDAPHFRFEEADHPDGVPAKLDVSLGFPRVIGECSWLSLHDEIVRITLYEEDWTEEGFDVRRDCAVKLDLSEGRSVLLLVDDSSGPTVTAAFTPKGIQSLSRYLTVRTVLR